MDKKNLILGIGFICAAFASLYVGQALSPKPPATAPAVREAVGQTAANPANAPAAPATAGAPSQPPTLSAGGPSASFASATGDNANARVTTLENDFIKVRFTDYGGALRDVALKKFPAIQGQPAPFVFNELHVDPMLALTEFPGLDRNTRYNVIRSNSTEIVFKPSSTSALR